MGNSTFPTHSAGRHQIEAGTHNFESSSREASQREVSKSIGRENGAINLDITWNDRILWASATT
jgi:hypothetical protein